MKNIWKTLKKIYVWMVMVTYPIMVAALLGLLYLAFVLFSSYVAYPN